MKGFQVVVTIILLIQTLLLGSIYISVAEIEDDFSVYLDIYENKFNDVISSVDDVWASIETFRRQSI